MSKALIVVDAVAVDVAFDVAVTVHSVPSFVVLMR